MTSNNTTQGRSMNNIIEFDGIENLNVDNIIAENIDVDNLQIENSLFVDNTTITPQELSFIQNASSNIQQQINNISNEFVTLDTTQTITGDKTFSGTTTITGNVDVSGISITPQELSFLDGLQSNIQTQLDNAGIGNAVTTNTDQVITGKKTFTQKINIPSVEVSDQSAVLKGFVTDTTNLAYSDIQGLIPAVNSTTLIGSGVNSTITNNDVRAGTSGGDFTLANASTPSIPIQNVDAYLSTRGSNTDNYTFENTSLIQDLSGTDFFTGLEWLSSSLVTIPIFINDFVLVKNGFDIQMVSNSGNVLPNTSQVSGYVFDSTTFITNDNIDERFLEGTGLIRPVKITSITNNRHQISSPNQITSTPINDNVIGYFHDANTIFYSVENGDVQTGSFIKGNNLNGSATITSKDISLNSLTIQNNLFVTQPSSTKIGYIYFEPDIQVNGIVFEDVIGLEQFQFVENTGITLGNHYINTLTGQFVVLDTQALVPTPILRDGYLFSSSVLVSNDISLNSFIVSPPDIPDISTTRVTTVNASFVNLSTSNNTPTPNSKTYNGFSTSETEFYYNNDDTNVEIDYYLKNIAIQIPTTDHLITSVDIVSKKLTTENLPITSPSISVNGYTNITLNKIITETVQSINVGDGIDSALINTGSRFVSFVNGLEIDVSGTLNTTARIFDTTGFCSQSNQSIVYDPNTRLEVGNFLVDYDLNAIPVNSIISSITSIGFDIFQVGLSSSLTFTPSSLTTFTDAYKLTSNTLAVNSPTLNDKVYQISGDYRYITGTTAEPNVYNTNDSGSSDLIVSNLTYINIQINNNERVLLLTQTNIKTASGFFNRYLQNDTLIPAQCFVKTGNTVSGENGVIPITQILNSNLYQDYNFGTVNTNPFYVGATSNDVDKFIFDHFGTFLYVSGLDGPSSQSFENQGVQYIPATGDISLELPVNNGGVLTQALNTVYTGLVFDQTGLDASGNMGRITQFPPNFSNHVIPFANAVTGTRDVRASVYDVGEVYNEPQIVMFGDIAPNTFIFVYESSIDRYQYARVKSTLALPFNSFRYDLDRNVIIDRSTQSTVQWLTLETTFNVNLAFPGRVFTGAKIRPSTAINVYNPNPVTVPDSQVEYESITPTSINIYSSFDSYESYEKKTFQEYIPSEFEIFNTQIVDNVIPVNYDTFEKLNFNVYNLDTFIGQTFYDVGFPNNQNNELFVLQDTVQVLTNKTFDNITATGDIDCVNLTATGDIGCNDLTATGNIDCVDITGSGLLDMTDITQEHKLGNVYIGRQFTATSDNFGISLGSSFFDVNNQMISRNVVNNITAVNTKGELHLRVNNGNQMILRPGNFRAFKPVNNNNGNFGNSLLRTIATNVSFNGGVLVVLFNISGFIGSGVGLATFTLECLNSSNQIIWSFENKFFFNTRQFHLNYGTNTGVFTGIPAQTGASLRLRRVSGNLIQDFNDFTNVTIFELPLS